MKLHGHCVEPPVAAAGHGADGAADAVTVLVPLGDAAVLAPGPAPVPAPAPGSWPGPGDPVFFVHPAGGSVWAYRPLALQVGAPTFGLQAPALEAGQSMPASVAAMAAAYVQAVRRAQATGPYRLLGWSSGGIIALLAEASMAAWLPAVRAAWSVDGV